jgi:hypothetical protein
VSTIQFSSDDDDSDSNSSSFDSYYDTKYPKNTNEIIKSPVPDLPKAKKSDSQPFPQIAKEVSITTDVPPKEIVKQLIEQELGLDKSTNFTDAGKINKLGAKTYTTKTCNIQVDALKPLSKNSGISGAGIFVFIPDG